MIGASIVVVAGGAAAASVVAVVVVVAVLCALLLPTRTLWCLAEMLAGQRSAHGFDWSRGCLAWLATARLSDMH